MSYAEGLRGELRKAAMRLANQYYKLKREVLIAVENEVVELKRKHGEDGLGYAMDDVYLFLNKLVEDLFDKISAEAIKRLEFIVKPYIDALATLEAKVARERERREEVEKENRELKGKLKKLKGEVEKLKRIAESSELEKLQKEIASLREELKKKNEYIKKLVSKDSILNVISVLEEKPMTITEIAFKLGKTEGTIRKYIKRLEDGGFVKVDRGQKPYRVFLVKKPWE